MRRVSEPDGKANIPSAIGPNKDEFGLPGDVLLTVPQAAEFLNWATGTVYHKLHQLPGVVHLSSRCVRIWKSALIGFAKEHTRP
jgi:hypothetical protein